MHDFIKIEMYKCRWCGKIFRTSFRHRCKFRPSFENCFSCANCTGVRFETQEGDNYPNKVMVCTVKDGASISEIARKNWELHCPMWKLAEDYSGKDSYVRKTLLLRSYHTRPFPEIDEDNILDDDDDDSIPF